MAKDSRPETFGWCDEQLAMEFSKMKRRTRTYEVEMDGTSVLVEIVDLGEGPNGMGRAYRLQIGDQDPIEVVGEQLHAGKLESVEPGSFI